MLGYVPATAIGLIPGTLGGFTTHTLKYLSGKESGGDALEGFFVGLERTLVEAALPVPLAEGISWGVPDSHVEGLLRDINQAGFGVIGHQAPSQGVAATRHGVGRK